MTRPLVSYRLPPGRHGLSPESVADNQRWRVLAATAEELAETGYLRLTAHAIASRAAVSRTTLYAHFAGVDACVAAAFTAAASDLLATCDSACAAHRPPADPLRAVIDAISELLAAEPTIAALLGSEASIAVPALAPARRALLDDLARRLQGLPAASRQGSAERESLLAPPAIAALCGSAGGRESDDDLADQLVTLLRLCGGAYA